MDDAAVQALLGGGGAQLRSLRLAGCKKVTSRALAALAQAAEALEELDVDGTAVCDEVEILPLRTRTHTLAHAHPYKVASHERLALEEWVWMACGETATSPHTCGAHMCEALRVLKHQQAYPYKHYHLIGYCSYPLLLLAHEKSTTHFT